MEGQGESSIAPLFQSGATVINTGHFYVPEKVFSLSIIYVKRAAD